MMKEDNILNIEENINLKSLRNGLSAGEVFRNTNPRKISGGFKLSTESTLYNSLQMKQ